MLSKEFYEDYKRELEIVQQEMYNIRCDFSNNKINKARKNIIIYELKGILEVESYLDHDYYKNDLKLLKECIASTNLLNPRKSDGRYFRGSFPGGYYNFAEDSLFYCPDELEEGE